jgi:hypothetical protein
MSLPTLRPAQSAPTNILPETGSVSDAATVVNYPYGLYTDETSPLYDSNFVSGAADQVNYTFRKLGGDVLDVELTQKNIFAAYEEAVLEYSYIVNIHQGKNTLGSALGATTGSFDHDGMHTGDSALSGTNIELRFPKFKIGYAKQVTDAVATEAGIGGTENIFSASIGLTSSVQDYDLQTMISSSANNSASEYFNSVGNKRVTIRRVYYKTPHAMWRFFGYYGGINAIGNLSTYGMYADDSTFEVIPAWQNKAQAMAYEDTIYTRNSHYSYEIKNNKLRLFPVPQDITPDNLYVEFTLATDPWDESDNSRKSGTDGVNNLNTLPFTNLQYKSINSIGKQWIRRFALALSKEMLGQIRGKFASLPIPGESVTLNHAELLSQAKDEQNSLREELKTVLDELTYSKLVATESEIMDSSNKIMQNVPYNIFVG